MTTRTEETGAGETGGHRRMIAAGAPVVVVALAGMAVRTPLALAYPFAALLLFLWVVADTMMLALVARSAGRPPARAVVGVLAGASLTVWLGSPPAVRDVLRATPWLARAMAVVLIGHAGWAMARARAALTGRRHSGVGRTRWTAALSEILPPALARLAVAEAMVIHIALFRWGGPADVPPGARAFAYHRHLAPMCTALLILSGIEMAVYHLLVGHWSRTAAVVMFVVSDIGFVYLVGLIKSFRFRPVLVTAEGVRVRAGFLIDRLIPFDTIVAVEEVCSGAAVRDPATLNAALLLAWPNVLLRLDPPLPRPGWQRRGPFDRIAFRLDDPAPFLRLLAWRLGQA